MSLPLHDFRGGITPETKAVLDARATAHGTTMQDVARDVLHEWALREIRAASLLTAAVKRDGLATERAGGDAG